MPALTHTNVPQDPDRSSLADTFAGIDGIGACGVVRRFLRAAAAYNCGCLDVWHDEMRAGLAECADHLGVSPREVERVILPVVLSLAHAPREPN